jgi:ABC-type sugar transport system ATPase subunit
MGVIIISDEIPEVIRNCNRIIVMRGGRIIKKLNIDEVTEDKLMDILARKSN